MKKPASGLVHEAGSWFLPFWAQTPLSRLVVRLVALALLISLLGIFDGIHTIPRKRFSQV